MACVPQRRVFRGGGGGKAIRAIVRICFSRGSLRGEHTGSQSVRLWSVAGLPSFAEGSLSCQHSRRRGVCLCTAGWLADGPRPAGVLAGLVTMTGRSPVMAPHTCPEPAAAGGGGQEQDRERGQAGSRGCGCGQGQGGCLGSPAVISTLSSCC